MYRTLAGFAALACSVALLSGCVTGPAPVNYAPTSVKTVKGAVGVGDFVYLPSEPGAAKKVDPDVIQNTAVGTVRIDRPVKTFVRDAVFAELRIVGVNVSDTQKILTGEIEEFLIDDLGFNVDWTLRIKYTIHDAKTNAAIYQSDKLEKRRTGKFMNPFGAINETIKLDVEEMLDDPDFVKAIN